MRTLLVFLAAFPATFLAASAVHADWKLVAVPAWDKLTATAPGELQPFRLPYHFEVAGRHGAWVDFQVVVKAGKTPLTVTGASAAFEPTEIAPEPQVYVENYVYVRHPSGNRILQRLWWPDALIPVALWSGVDLAPSSATVLWVSAQLPPGPAPGPDQIEVTVHSDAGDMSIEVPVDAQAGEQPAPTFRANVAVYYDDLRAWYARNAHRNFTDSEWELEKRRYYDFLLDYGFNAYDLPVPWGSPDAAVYLQNPRVLSVRVPPIDSPTFQVALDQLHATGTLKKAYSYTIDEPSPADYPAIKAMTARLRPLGIKHLVTVHPNAPLAGQVDIWCPNIGDWFGIGHVDLAALAAERAAGHETWCYTMVQPKYPQPTWLLDDDGYFVSIWGSSMYHCGYTGCVYSMAHGWGPDPLHDLTSFAGTNGDGTLVYPAELVGGSGPMPSIRLMLLREGFEYYELSVANAVPRLTGADYAHLDAISRPTEALENLPNGDWTTAVEHFLRFGADVAPVNPTSATIMVHGDYLDLTVDAEAIQEGEWIAVDIAPEDLRAQPEWLRFKVTERGELSVNRRTRAGDFVEQVPGFTAHLDVEAEHWTATLQVPWRHLGYPLPLRVDVRRRTEDAATGTSELLSAWPDAGDPYLMPVLAWGDSGRSAP